jgi:type IV secretory pathway VirB3-like protein
MSGFRARLAEQRWDDHRYYHHSLVNQSLHFISASTFITAYIVLFHDPAIASLLGWCVAMTSRQAGHFFFEPKGYDYVNDVTHEYKEEVKVGYNLARKWVLMTLWALAPVVLLAEPTFFGLCVEPASTTDFLRHLGIVWLVLAVVGLLFRILQLCVTRDVWTGVTWGVKILTDPFNDFRLYRKAPIRLCRGERMEDETLDETLLAGH